MCIPKIVKDFGSLKSIKEIPISEYPVKSCSCLAVNVKLKMSGKTNSTKIQRSFIAVQQMDPPDEHTFIPVENY